MSKTDTKALIISSKFFWYTKEFIPYLENLPDLKTHIFKQHILIRVSKTEHINYLSQILDVINYTPLQDKEKDDFQNKTNFHLDLVLPPEIPIPQWDWELCSKNLRKLLELLKEVQKDLPEVSSIIQIALAGITRNIRVVGNTAHPLKALLDSLINFKTNVNLILRLFDEWIKTPDGELWGLKSSSNQNFYLPYSLFVHLYRAPVDDNPLIDFYLKEQLKSLLESKKTYFVTDIPLLSPKLRQFPVIQCVLEENDITDIATYWKIFSSLILRTLAYTITKTPMIKNQKDTINQMLLAVFNKKLEKNLEKFVETCISSSVIFSNKLYKKLFDRDFNYKRYSEFYSIYRGGVLEKRFKSAEQEFYKTPKNKHTSRRLNRRKRYLVEFIMNFFEVYGYLAFEGLYLYKSYRTLNLTKVTDIYHHVIQKYNQRNKILSESTDPLDFPEIYSLNIEIKDKYKWLICSHNRKGLYSDTIIETVSTS